MYQIFLTAELGYLHRSTEFIPITYPHAIEFRSKDWNGTFKPVSVDSAFRMLSQCARPDKPDVRHRIGATHIRLTYNEDTYVMERAPRVFPYRAVNEIAPNNKPVYVLEEFELGADVPVESIKVVRVKKPFAKATYEVQLQVGLG